VEQAEWPPAMTNRSAWQADSIARSASIVMKQFSSG
jgi:hypothetical protein